MAVRAFTGLQVKPSGEPTNKPVGNLVGEPIGVLEGSDKYFALDLENVIPS